MNQFKFHSVGQGLFYTGSLANGRYNFVYDCGTESGKQYIQRAIEEYVEEIRDFDGVKPTIDFVVISHLHADHFNGLYELSKQVNIKKVYLPYLGEDLLVKKVVLYNELVLNSREENNIEPARSAYNFATRLYTTEVGVFENIESIEFLGKNAESFDEEGFCYSSKEESYLQRGKEYWRFVFVNKTISLAQQQKLGQAIANKKEVLGGSLSCDEIKKESIKELAEVYRETFGNNQNITSTLLYHYPVHLRSFGLKGGNRTCCLCNSLCGGFHYRARTLLTGDAEFTQQFINELENLFEKSIIYKYVDVLQIPHHGAKKNWESLQKTQIRSKCYVISFGLWNKYGHPYKAMIEEYLGQIFLVNEVDGFEHNIF